MFVSGRRQVGKTSFALALLESGSKDETNSAYLNCDRGEHRERLLKGEMPAGQSLLILDEIHKSARWRNLVKGLHDTRRSKPSILVIGSARLDYYHKGGDSLQGRYHYYRLHPLFYQAHLSNQSFVYAPTGIRVLPYHRFCRELGLP